MIKTTMPRMKPNLPFFSLGNSIYVHGAGVVHEVEDPDGLVGRLLRLADGTRTADEIAHLVSAEYQNVGKPNIYLLLAQLDSAGFIEDANHASTAGLDDYSLTRWTRNLSFFEGYSSLTQSKYEFQRRLRDATVTLLGVGGVGSHILFGLASLGVGRVRLVDFDRVELSNLNRQILYTEADIGKLKVETAAKRIQTYAHRIEVEPNAIRIESAEDVARVATGSDVVIGVADRPTMRITNWINKGCVDAQVPLITGGLETQRAVFYSVTPGKSACGICWQRQVIESDDTEASLLKRRRELDFSAAPAAFAPLVSIVAGLILGEAVRYITGIAPPVANGQLFEIKYDTYETSVAEKWQKHPLCEVCGPSAAAA